MSWKRNLVILVAVQVLGTMAWGMVKPFLPLFVIDLGVDNESQQRFWAGVLQGAPLFCTALLGVVWGTVADRWGRKTMVIRGLVGTGLVVFFMRYVTNVHQLLGFRLIQGILGGGFVAASIVLMTSLAPRDRTGITVGVLQAAVAAGFGVGPIIGGFLADTFDYRCLFGVSAGLYALATLIVVIFVREPKLNHAPGSEPRLSHSVSAFLKSPALLGLAASLFVTLVAIGMIEPVIALFVKQKLLADSQLLQRWGNTLVGGVSSAVLVVVVAAPFWGYLADRFGHKRILLICALGAAIILPLHALAEGVILFGLFQLLLRASTGGIRPTARAFISHLASRRQLGGVFGATNTALLMGAATGPFLGGWCAGYFGDRMTFVAAGVVGLAGLLIGWWLIPGRHNPDRSQERHA